MRFFNKKAYNSSIPLELDTYSIITNYEYTIVNMKKMFGAKTPIFLYPLSNFDEDYLELKNKFEDHFSFFCFSHKIAKRLNLSFIFGPSIILYPKSAKPLFELVQLNNLDVNSIIVSFKNKFVSAKLLYEITKMETYDPYHYFVHLMVVLNALRLSLFKYNFKIINCYFNLLIHGKYNTIRT